MIEFVVGLMIEGAYYVWTRREFDDILKDEAEIAAAYWNVQAAGNVDSSHDIQGELEEQVRDIVSANVKSRMFWPWSRHTRNLAKSFRSRRRRSKKQLSCVEGSYSNIVVSIDRDRILIARYCDTVGCVNPRL